jgi:uncharacterized membrane protein HdeD (DUF308 family)
MWIGLVLLVAGLIALFMSAKDSSDLRKLQRGDEDVTPIGGQTRCFLNILFALMFVIAGVLVLKNSHSMTKIITPL